MILPAKTGGIFYDHPGIVAFIITCQAAPKF
jgi:hypothetical protein